jgi:hypothetical protein
MTVPINIFLHGYFFTEAQADKLVIASPKYDMHMFGYWDDQQLTWKAFPSTPFTWIQQLRGGGEADFPDDTLQFSRDNLGLKTPFIPPPGGGVEYAVYIELPFPSRIDSVRDGGNINEFLMKKGGKIEGSVHGHCGTNHEMSLITQLVYVANGPIGFTDINFYAEHCMEPDWKELNDLFTKTKAVFPQFDLWLTGPIKGKKLPGPDSDNEKTLCELGAKLNGNPCVCDPKKQDRSKKDPAPLIRTANCPQFGVVQT